MSDNIYDIEEIIAEIKSEREKAARTPAEKKNGNVTDDRSFGRALKDPSEVRGKREAAAQPKKSGKPILPKSDKPIKLSPDKKAGAHSKSAGKVKKSELPKKDIKDKSENIGFKPGDSLFSKELDEFFSSDLPPKRTSKKAKKQKTSKVKEEIEIRDISGKNNNGTNGKSGLRQKGTKQKTASADSASREEAIPFDFLNTLYSDPAEASESIAKRTVTITLQLVLLFAVFALSLYMTLAFPLNLPMPSGFSYFETPFLYLLTFFALDFLAVILAIDVTAPGLFRLAKGKPTMDTLVLFSSICSMLYILTVLIKPQWGGWLPFTSVSVMQCFFALLSKRRRYVTLRRTYRILQSDSSPVAVKAQGPRRDRIAYKSYKNVFPEMGDCASLDTTEKLGLYYAPLAMAVCIVLAAAASLGRQDAKSFTWCLSALSVMALSPALLISSALPGSIVSRRLYASGTALLSNRAGKTLASCQSAIITDEDIFPNGSVVINSLKIGDGFSLEYAYSVAASALEAIGGGLFNVFDEATTQLYSEKLPIEDVKFFETGGMSAKVDGRYVLLGNVSFIRRMGISVLQGVKLQNCLYMSIDSVFAGVFSVKYAAQPSVYSAFRMLRRAKTTPILATRDFLATEAFIEDKFKLRAESCEYPSVEERVHLSSDSFEHSEPLAILSRGNMFSFSELLLYCRSLRRSIIFNLFCSIAAAAVGLFIMYFLVSNMEVSSATPVNVLVYLGCWTVPVWLSSLIFTRF